MVLYHSCTTVGAIRHLLACVENKVDDLLYATMHPQTDYGRFIVRFLVDDDLLEDSGSYDQGGRFSPTGNIAVPMSAIDINTMEVFD